jgi:DNA-binding transcriptional LysR family regulator
MERLLDVAPLRSFVAVADCGGFQRAAVTLHLSQGAVSQHVRRLESATGRQLMERQGRRSRFTADGELLLSHARRILAVHDEALRSFVDIDGDLVIGSTEHAAAQLLPPLAGALEQALPGYRLRFRIDRGTPLRESLAAGRIDLALLLGPGDSTCVTVGELPLNWYSAPGWVWPTDTALPLVAFDAPCVLRTRALDTLSEHGIPSVIGSEAIQVAGVQAAVRAGRRWDRPRKAWSPATTFRLRRPSCSPSGLGRALTARSSPVRRKRYDHCSCPAFERNQHDRPFPPATAPRDAT